MTTLFFETHLFQLNTAGDTKGDSAIILLVQKDSSVLLPNTQQANGTIKSAILLDTGKGEITAEVILRTIKRIEADYLGYNATTFLKFDAFVISHWDDDHYKGLFSFLAKKEIYDSPTAPTKCKYFTYSTTNDPLTRFYCQSWPPASLKYKNPTGYGYNNNCRILKSDSNQNVNNPFDLSIVLNPSAVAKNRLIVPKAFKVYATTDLFNGVNLFTGKFLKGQTWNQVTSLAMLVASNDPYSQAADDSINWPGAPGLYVAGVNDSVLGNTGQLTSVGPSAAGRDDSGLVGVIDDPSHTDTNFNSILTLLIWKNKDATKTPKVSLYSGGDAEWENKIANFVAGEKIQVVKAGHHGSAAGTSTKFINAVKPDHYLISAGIEHGHPSKENDNPSSSGNGDLTQSIAPEVLLYMDAWFSQNRAMDIDGRVILKRLHGVVFPYHLGWVTDDTVQPYGVRYFRNLLTDPDLFTLNMLSVVNPNTEQRQYITFVKWLVQTYTALGIPNPLTAYTNEVNIIITNDGPAFETASAAFKALGKRKSKNVQETYEDAKAKYALDKSRFLSPYLATSWLKWSRTMYQYFPYRAFDEEIKAGSITGPPVELKQLDYILFKFSYDTVKDGLRSAVSLVAKAGNLVPEDVISVPTAKVAKLNPPTPPVTPPPKLQNFDFQVQNNNLTSSMGLGSVRLSNKRRMTQQTTITELFFKMSVNDEANIHLHENDGDLTMTPNAAMDIELQSNEVPPPTPIGTGAPLASMASVSTPSMIYPSDGLAGSGIINLADASDSDYFVAALQCGYLSLTEVETDNDSTWSGSLQSQDNLYLWMTSFFDGPISLDGITFRGTLTSPYIINEVNILTMMPGRGSSVEVNFSSDLATIAHSLNFEVTDPTLTSLVSSSGFLIKSTGLILGLQVSESSTMLSMTLSQIFEFLEWDLPPFMDSSAILTLDSDASSTNAIWFCPNENYRAIWRMTFSGETDSAWMSPAIPGFTFTNCKSIATKQSYLQQVAGSTGAAMDFIVSTGSICIQADTTLNASSLSAFTWSTILNVSSTKASLILRWNNPEHDPISDFFAWLTTPSGNWGGIGIGRAWTDFQSIMSVFKELHLREVAIEADHANRTWTFRSFSVTFELDLNWGVTTSDARVPIALKFIYIHGDSPYVELSGGLWQKSADNIERLNPDSMPYPSLSPSYLTPQYFISLAALSNRSTPMPPDGVLPTYITQLNLTLSTQDISFTGMMVSDPTGAGKPTSWISFDKVWINAVYTMNMSSLSFQFYAEIVLTPRLQAPTYSATLGIDIAYDSDGATWTIIGTVVDLNVGCLYSLFPGTDNDAVMDVMEDITVEYLEITYIYASGSSCFNATGTISLGEVDLNLTFTQSPTDGWKFFAELDANFSSTGVSMGEFLTGVSSDLTDTLPDMITSIDFAIPSDSSIKLTCMKATDEFMLLSIVAAVGDFEFAFVQLTPALVTPPGEVPIVNTPKRLLKFTMGGLPPVPDVPLLNEFSQPFDQMDFFWSSDDLTRGEVAILNANVFSSRHDQICYKDPRLQTSDTTVLGAGGDQALDKVVLKGCHFQVIVEQNNVPTPVLDYIFAGQVTPKSETTENFDSGAGVGGPLPRSSPTDSSSNGSAVGAWTKTIGPLNISAIGLKYQSRTLQITFDASIKLSPIAGNVKGFGIRFPLDDLTKFSTDGMTVLFDGIGLELDAPPVALAGLLVHNSDGSFQGGISIQVEPYTFIAGGYYNDVVSGNDSYKSLFVFAQLEGVIAEFEFATLSDLEGGVGYNSQVTLPTIENVTSFPFLQKSSPGPNLLNIMNNYLSGGWFTSKHGPCWIAGGLSVKAFQTVNIDAVVIIDLSEDIVFGIYAHVLSEIPASATNDNELFARVDMGFLAVIDPGKGTFRAEGQLTPKSFILDKNCHLTGGFALCYWFEGSGHEGDWVFTVGGYHAAYSPPTWYPRPPRLAISWQYDSTISIHGEAYFAITPKVCMGGGSLRLNYQSGNLSAYLDAYADFLINYQPFSFTARVGVDVGVEYTLDLYFTTKHFDVHFGCSLDMHGPPVAGTVHIDWCIISFDVHFGNSSPRTQPLLWVEFCALLRQEKGVAIDDGGKKEHTIAATAGTISDNNNKSSQIQATSNDMMLVDASNFAFRFMTLFPVSTITYTSGDTNGPAPQSQDPFYIKPMHIGAPTAVSSALVVTITDSLGQPARFFYEAIQKQVPTALWGPYDSNKDPMIGNSSINELLNPGGGTTLQTMGVQFLGPESTSSADDVQFNIDLGSVSPTFQSHLPNQTSPPPPSSLPMITFSQNLASYSPLTPPIPYAPRTVLSRLTNPQISSADVITSWIGWQNVTTDAPLGKALANLGSTTGTPNAWVQELLQEPTQPLMVLSAKASAQALAGQEVGLGNRGTGVPLGRDWLDGGFLGFP